MSIMDSIRGSRLFQRLMRVLQFLSAIISLGLFSARVAKIIRLARLARNAGRVTPNGVSTSNGAVEGILAAASLYTLTVMIISLVKKAKGGSKALRWLLILMDILFLAAFIVVAVLTRPNGGSSGPCRNSRFRRLIPSGSNCSLPWGTFILAIVSTVLHFLTALFHEARDHHKHKHNNEKENEYMHSNPAVEANRR